jgi:CheY-like chemotaxis protein
MFKIIFMDIQMPEMDGIETTSKILKILEEYNKAMEESKKVKSFIVGLTSYTGDN